MMMKTIEELFEEILASKELREELRATTDKTLGAFLKKHGCNADPKEFMAFLRSHSEGELEDVDAETVAGGIPIFC